MKKAIVNGFETTYVDMTEEEIAIKNASADATYDGTYKTFSESENAKADIKASAKAKLIAGEALTEEEANTIVI